MHQSSASEKVKNIQELTSVLSVGRYRTGRTSWKGNGLKWAYTLRRKFHRFAYVTCGNFLSKTRYLLMLGFFLHAQVQLNSVSLSVPIPSACGACTAATAQVCQCFVIHNMCLFTTSCEHRHGKSFCLHSIERLICLWS